MRLFWICVVAILIVLALYVAIHRILINRATLMLRNRAQQVTDEAVNQSLQKLLGWDKQLSSQLVADVWGKGVLAFEYHFDYRQLEKSLDRDRLSQELTAYAEHKKLSAFKPGRPVFVVTDWWEYEGILHIDVAYLLNESTVEYVSDLKRLNRHSK
ncbi:hypothetical protein [Limosilactobacillus kribbianus]|uniref:hypothetical protein n=1 Tax=Limosilactobacillus kribbianus TaxID=2982695 RepID=UPI00226452A1|nr:hypothetical protein [Limosilactobacillus kribbianus]